MGISPDPCHLGGVMPVGGFVATLSMESLTQTASSLNSMGNVELHGPDEDGRAILVLETTTSKEMESLVERLKTIPGVLAIDLAYLNVEDEVEKRRNRD